MNRLAVLLYFALGLFLLGFGLAAVTAGAPAAVAAGTLGLLGTLAAVIARIESETGEGGLSHGP